MTFASAVLLLLAAPPSRLQAAAPATGEVIAAVRVHGNQMTPDDEIVRLSGLVVGAPFQPDTVDQVRQRLEATTRFRDVQVLKRFASIADPLQVLVVIVVNEGPLSVEAGVEADAPVRVRRRRVLANLLVAPILDGEDGYGLTLGARVAWTGIGGPRGRVSAPLTWGGWRRAGLEYERQFSRGPLTRLMVGTSIESRRNPAFDESARQARVWGRAERTVGPFRAAGTAGVSHVRFGPLHDRLRSVGAEVAFDTRLDPMVPRNAIYVLGSAEWIGIDNARILRRTRVDARGYLALLGQSVLVLRAVREGANGRLPPYLQPLLGGWSSLRGHKAGAFVGDFLTAASIEVRVPLTSPRRVGKLGVSVFTDAGKAYPFGVRYDDVPLRQGSGVSVWYTVTVFQVGVGVAHAHGGGTRATFGAGLRF